MFSSTVSNRMSSTGRESKKVTTALMFGPAASEKNFAEVSTIFGNEKRSFVKSWNFFP